MSEPRRGEKPLAHGASRGNAGTRIASPGGGGRTASLSPLTGLSPIVHLFPRLAPWANLSRGCAALFLLTFTLHAQPAIQTELRNGVLRAVVLHPSGDPVTDASPAQPGETLTVLGSALSSVQLLI